MSKPTTIKDIDIKGRDVMIRAGLETPLDDSKDFRDPDRVTIPLRIEEFMPTLTYVLEQNPNKVIILGGWCGRPEGIDPKFSMAGTAKRLEQMLVEAGFDSYKIKFTPDCFEDGKPKSVYENKEIVQKAVADLRPKEILFLETERYDPGAATNNQAIAKFYASLVGKGGVYVSEAPPQAHRPTSTIIGAPIEIANNGGDVVYGIQYANVLRDMGGLRDRIKDRRKGYFVLALCGVKMETGPGITSKVTVAIDLMDQMRKGDYVITGGAVTYAFLLAQHYSSTIEGKINSVDKIIERYEQRMETETTDMGGKERKKHIAQLQQQESQELENLLGINAEGIKKLIGESYIEKGQVGEQIVSAYKFMVKAKKKGIEVITAYDHTITDTQMKKDHTLPDEAKIKLHGSAMEIPKGWRGVGLGDKTLTKIAGIIENAEIYLQSGPYSIEDLRVEEFSKTDERIFQAVRKCKENGGTTIGAGGDTTGRIYEVCKRLNWKVEDIFTTAASAGGATLELIRDGYSNASKAVEEAQLLKGNNI